MKDIKDKLDELPIDIKLRAVDRLKVHIISA